MLHCNVWERLRVSMDCNWVCVTGISYEFPNKLWFHMVPAKKNSTNWDASPTQPIKLGPEGPVICRMQQEDTRSRFFYKGGPYLWTISISDPCCIHIQILICQILIYHINTEPGIYLFDIPYQYCKCLAVAPVHNASKSSLAVDLIPCCYWRLALCGNAARCRANRYQCTQFPRWELHKRVGHVHHLVHFSSRNTLVAWSQDLIQYGAPREWRIWPLMEISWSSYPIQHIV